ncbi:MAG: ABC transporter permease, partial [Acidimicrobiaceae bacterium]|nr:ABC transporter permease [Acidimicrobiaceae bacterium]
MRSRAARATAPPRRDRVRSPIRGASGPMTEMLEIFDMNWVAQGIRLSVPLVFAALGGLLSERAGVINIALEGKMLFGAFAGVAVTWWTGANVLGLVAALAAGAGIGWVHAWFSITVRADQIVSATAINLFALGVTAALIPAIWEGGRANTPGVERFRRFEVPVLADLPEVGTVFSRLGWFDYGALVLAPVVWVVLWRSPFGLRLRACGESPEAAASVGVNVIRTRYTAVMLAGVFAALGGVYLSLVQNGLFQRGITNGRGFLALAAMIFGKWRPIPVLGACLLFGMADAY